MKSRALTPLLIFVICVQLAIIGRLSLNRPLIDAGALTQNSPPPSDQASAPKENVASPQTEAFRWARLESSDYRAYVQNLRSIQCPEQTIRDIITADVDANLYAARRQALRAQEQELGGSSGSAIRGNIGQAKGDLWHEEFSLIARILGQDAAEQGTAQRAVPTRAASRRESRPALMPLAFAVSAEELPELSDYQRAALERFRETFTSRLDGLNSSSPEYDQQWRKAQPEVDAAMEAALGAQAYQELRLQALRQEVTGAKAQN